LVKVTAARTCKAVNWLLDFQRPVLSALVGTMMPIILSPLHHDVTEVKLSLGPKEVVNRRELGVPLQAERDVWRGRVQQEVLCTDSVEQLGGVPGNEVAEEQIRVGRQKRLGLGLLRGLTVGSLAVATGFLARHRTVGLGLDLGTVKAPPLSRL
jgi:hypothetical protein